MPAVEARATRQPILDVAAWPFREQGDAGTAQREIAKRCDIQAASRCLALRDGSERSWAELVAQGIRRGGTRRRPDLVVGRLVLLGALHRTVESWACTAPRRRSARRAHG